jgi:hypothetical protein
MTGFADLWPVPNPNDTHVVKFSDTRNVDAVYRERTFVVAALARTVTDYHTDIGAAEGAWLSRHVGPWEEDWRWIVCIDLGSSVGLAGEIGVVTWHIHDSELALFEFLNPRGAPDYIYDGHSTDEKYRRIYQYVTGRKV